MNLLSTRKTHYQLFLRKSKLYLNYMSLFVFTVNATVSCFLHSTQCNSRVWPEAGCVIMQ